jgi:hypothetical protein
MTLPTFVSEEKRSTASFTSRMLTCPKADYNIFSSGLESYLLNNLHRLRALNEETKDMEDGIRMWDLPREEERIAERQLQTTVDQWHNSRKSLSTDYLMKRRPKNGPWQILHDFEGKLMTNSYEARKATTGQMTDCFDREALLGC